MNKETKYEKIRAIAGTVLGDRFAVSEWENDVQIWDINEGFIRKISTDLVAGMSKALSISEDGKQLCVAGYDRKTITLYDIDTGEIIWQRTDIRKPATSIILNSSENLVYVDTENKGSFFLDRTDGKTIEKPKGLEFVRESPYSNIDQYIKSTTSSLVNRSSRKTIKSFTYKSFAILDSAFSKELIVCSYSGNPLEAISLDNFSTLWTRNVVGHFLEIEYSIALNKVLGIRWEYEKGGPKFLSYISIDSGVVEKEINLGEPIELEFLKQGSLLITSQGKLYATKSGDIIKEFDFENK